jgi:hypothetical protein
LEVSRAFKIAGRWPTNSTSTTAPMTWTIRPVATADFGAAGAFVAFGAAALAGAFLAGADFAGALGVVAMVSDSLG